MKYLFSLLGYASCILPCAIATLAHFPLWFSNRTQSISVISLLLLLLSLIPLWRTLKKRFFSPAPWTFWLVAFVLLTLLRNIVNGIWTVSFFALVGSLAGALFFALAKRFSKQSAQNGQANGTPSG